MLNKRNRLDAVRKLVDRKGTVRVSDIVETLNVSDMTVRRDLTELEEQGYLVRTHGGARSKGIFHHRELSHDDKHFINMPEKEKVAQKAVALIEEGDTIFLGPGTTVELLAEKIQLQALRVVTNCLPVFDILNKKKNENIKVYLIGGQMREVTKSFVGEVTNVVLETMHFNKMFFSSNAVKGNAIMTSTFEEGYTQQMALSHSIDKYLLLDSSKVGKEDFVTFYEVSKVNAVVLDSNEPDIVEQLSPYCHVICAD